MKHIKMFLCCCIILLLTACSSAGKYYEEGMENLEIKNYLVAEQAFKNAIDKGYTKDDVKVIYTIVSEYNLAKKSYDEGEYDESEQHIDKIPHTYPNYSIGIDINILKDQLKKIKELTSSITKAKNLLDADEWEDANGIILTLDTQYATDEQLSEVEDMKHQIKLKKKNNDYAVLEKIDLLVNTYANGLCEAVNTGDFRPLKGSLYEGSSIYNTQKSYIANMAKQDIYEYVDDVEVNSVEWTSETTCIISTTEIYTIYEGTSRRTQSFRYKYDVVETSDKQLFLTSIEKSL